MDIDTIKLIPELLAALRCTSRALAVEAVFTTAFIPPSDNSAKLEHSSSQTDHCSFWKVSTDHLKPSELWRARFVKLCGNHMSQAPRASWTADISDFAQRQFKWRMRMQVTSRSPTRKNLVAKNFTRIIARGPEPRQYSLGPLKWLLAHVLATHSMALYFRQHFVIEVQGLHQPSQHRPSPTSSCAPWKPWPFSAPNAFFLWKAIRPRSR